MNPAARSARQRGFTLAEVAIVFMIVALLIGGAVITFSAQNDAREIADTQKALEQAREAIIGFALRNGRLPCPATLGPGGSNGAESFCTGDDSGACGAPIIVPPNPAPAHGRCFNPAGFVPAGALGIGPIETNPASPNFGLLLDTWLQPVRYVVSQVNAPAPSPANRELYTAAGEMRNHLLTAPPVVPDLVVCTTSAGAVPGVAPALPACGVGPGFQTPAIVYSTGKNPVAVGADELENGNAEGRLFVSRPPSPAPAAFDDLVIWVSPNILYNRMIAAGAL